MVRTTSVTKSHNIFQTDVICRKYYVHNLIFIHGYMYNQGLLLLGITICCYDLVQHAVFKSRRNSFAGCHYVKDDICELSFHANNEESNDDGAFHCNGSTILDVSNVHDKVPSLFYVNKTLFQKSEVRSYLALLIFFSAIIFVTASR